MNNPGAGIPPSARKTRDGRPVVLVVDDNQDYLAVIGRTLSAGGCTPRLFADPEAALATLGRERVDLVLSDIRMPDASGAMDIEAGFKLLARIRHQWPDVPVSLLTGFSVDEYIKCALAHDVGNVLSKSASEQEILRCVHMWTTGEGVFGLEHYLPRGQAITARSFRTTADVHQLCDEIEKSLAACGYADVTRSRARIMIEEIAVNAIVHSEDTPRDPLRAPRALAPDVPSAQLSFGGTRQRFGLAVTDFLGRLTKRRVLESLANVVLEKKGTWQGGKPAVSGRGIYMTRAFAREYYINVKHHERTEVVLITDGDDRLPDVGKCSLKINEI